MKTILLAEDHALVRFGLKALLSEESDLAVIAETGDGAAVEQLVAQHQPDLLVLDLQLPGRSGFEIARRIKAQSPAVKILILTGNAEFEAVRRALAAGADGYILKLDDHDDIMSAVRGVLAGRLHIGKNLAAQFEAWRSSRGVSGAAAGGNSATVREMEILGLIADGLGNQEVAQGLNISVATVRTHRQNAMEKLDLHNAAEITAYVMQSKFASRA